MHVTFLGAPVNPTASPDAETIGGLEKRKIHKLTKAISNPHLISAQVEWILSFNLVNELNIQTPHGVTRLETNGNIHDDGGIWHGSNPIYLILREGATQEVLAKCLEVIQIRVPSEMPHAIDGFIGYKGRRGLAR